MMREGGTLLLILFLLAAMILGPTLLLRGRGAKPLRVSVEQERLIDAPNSPRALDNR